MLTLLMHVLYIEYLVPVLIELYLVSIIFLVLAAMFGVFAEKRILAFLIYFELGHLLCILLLLSYSLVGVGNLNLTELITVSLLIIGSSGAETGVALAIFMRYFRLTGRTTFTQVTKQRQPWHSSTLFNTMKIS
jgi:NADH:ubiquinone oxidoreductase subunit K